QLDEHRLGVTLGDVAGKGLGAALVTATLQATLRAIAFSFTSLDALASHVNGIVCRDGPPGRFVSMLYAELATGSGHVRFVNAGHMPPIVVRRDGIEIMPKGSAALGLLSDASYCEQCLDLEPGDMLVIYSDGVT